MNKAIMGKKTLFYIYPMLLQSFAFIVAMSAIFIFSCSSGNSNDNDISSSSKEENSSSSVVASSSSSIPVSSSVVYNSSSSVFNSSSYVAISSSSAEALSSSSIPISSSVVFNSSSSFVINVDLCVGFNSDEEVEHYGKMKKQICDERDGNRYAYITIGLQTWMAENLNYNAAGSVCYGEGDPLFSEAKIKDNCDTYGRLYSWATAMNGAASSTAIPSGIRGFCPFGWHLPSNDELSVLTGYVGEYHAGKELKAIGFWDHTSGMWTGTDEHGFSTLPAGYFSDGFCCIGINAFLWSATEEDNDWAWVRYITDNYDNVQKVSNKKTTLKSIRCVRD